jgi:FAD/FMN-containing dehydrogenase
VTGVATTAAGCTRSAPKPAATSTPPSIPTPSTPSSPPPSTPAGPRDLASLKKTLGDKLILPADNRYPAASQLFDPRFDTVHPAAIAKCTSPDDVTTCLQFAKASGTQFAVKAGGHSYAGYSTSSGLVIDVGAMNAITPAKTPGTARIEAGARLADVYAKLATQNASIPAGSCPTVGITGLALGGGIGVVGRKYGLTCDRLTAIELVTADGKKTRCDDKLDADLFWAQRGGGGGNFGVVTALEFATHRSQPLSYFLLWWDWPHAPDVLAAWQGWLPTTPDELWSSLHVDGAASSNTTPKVYVTGVYVGALAALQKLIDELQAAAKAPMSSRFAKQADYLHTMMIEGGCADLTLAQCRPQAEGGTLQRGEQLARSDYIATALTSSGIEVVLDGIEQRQQQGLPGGSVLFDAYGGAINRVKPTETAFAHRDQLACLQYVAPIFDASAAQANQAWLDGLHAKMRPHVSGYAYQNYIDPQLADWQHAYYGVNLDRLIDVKTAYDPDDLFRFAQSIPTR